MDKNAQKAKDQERRRQQRISRAREESFLQLEVINPCHYCRGQGEGKLPCACSMGGECPVEQDFSH